MLTPQSKGWTKRLGIVALLLLYVGIRAAGARLARMTPTDLETFFLPSAKIALAGHPLHIYEVRHREYPNANGPLGMVPLTIVAAIANQLGIVDDVVAFRVLVAVSFAIFPLLLAREAVRTVELLRGTPLAGVGRLLVYGVFALGPEAILSRGHGEQPLMLFLLCWSTRSVLLDRPALAGLLLGGALLTRTSTLLYLPPVTLLLAFKRQWGHALRFAGVGVLTLIGGLLPFALVDRENVAYSLFTSHELLPSLGGSLWEVVPGSALSSFGHHHDTTVALAASALFSLVLVARLPGLRRNSGAWYALLALCGLCLPLLMKSVWAYYYIDAYVLLAVSWLSGAPCFAEPPSLRWFAGAALPISALVTGALTAWTLRAHGRSWTPGWSLTIFAMTLGVLGMVASALYRQNRRVSAVPAHVNKW